MIPASIRTNNPGAMYPGPSAKKFGSTKYETLVSRDGTHKIACFDDPVKGAAAQFDLLSSNKYTGRSIKDAITKWCGGFYASTYLKVLEEKGGVTTDAILTPDLLRNPAVGIPLAKAMSWQEAGREYPMTDEQWHTAHALAFGMQQPAPVVIAKATGPVSFTPDNPLPSPKPETRVAEMKRSSRKWSIVSTLRWLVGLPTAALGVSESGVPINIPQIQGQLDAAQSLMASVGRLGAIGYLVIILVGLSLVRKFMVEDAESGRAVPSGSTVDVVAG